MFFRNITVPPLSLGWFMNLQSVRNRSTKCLRAQTSTLELLSSHCGSVIQASIEKGSPQKALLDYKTVLCRVTQLDQQTLLSVLEACKISLNFETVSCIHTSVIKSGFQSYPSIVSSLIANFVACGRIDDTNRLLGEIPRWGFHLVSANLIIAGYMKTGEFDHANRVFSQMPCKDVVSWNSMIAGCVRNARPKEAINIFQQMINSNFSPDGFAFASVLTACARTGALNHGEWVHKLMIEKQIELNFILSAALIDMYSKCGRIQTAKQIFNSIRRDDVSVWNAMITGLAIHGLASDAMAILSRMEREGQTPDSITFIGILTACSHCGLVDQGRDYFTSMKRHYLIEPQLEHYGAMVDLLGRAGLLEEAHSMIMEMPIQPDVVIWRALLSACRIHGKAELGEAAINQMARADSGDYVLLSNIYSSAKRWNSAQRVRQLMRKKGVRKNSGLSWIEVGGVVHQFKVGDQTHPESQAIYRVLERLSRRIKLEGFVPSRELVLMDISEEEKEGNLNCHSEKLATAYGILKTSPRTEIRVSKNLRTCLDCHGWMKVVSKVLNRVILVRDRLRFHRFESGSCSCGDYW
ncbi:PREDICTED: pentatricopeptide repeat-containing protein At5g50990 [Nelumbo nucifera]|uniref:Pentatricopeptide repeat-containing protein At5g50990 n=2 Tax=Nelumbo nucifera TaxID=4432 RepID=A0A1U8AF04_NELNU|nr:PREDICTED: pentatricopeptide repeat-containing protein At5g50990 [Nelumbo nucifera]DAD41800.1 TPA_asm: hypothetical protein HUJ06_016123 [Nelumbo nucifera]